jgi:hypothetical protein
MKYKIISGKYETGNEEQQMGYKMLFGEDNIQYKFDLYFHWYNLVHEMGHCLVEKYGLKLSPVQEEMYVNELAVSYYRYVGEEDRLEELRVMLVSILNHMPSPVPEGETFTSFFERIWGTELLMNVMTYGYFQLNSVLEAMKTGREFAEVISVLGVTISAYEVKKCKEEISSDNAEKFLAVAIENVNACGLEVPEISLELVDNPMIQCAQSE